MNQPSTEQFLRACGSAEPLRVGVGQRDEMLSESWTFQKPFLVIGRRPDSDLVLDHWQVSRRHTYLQLIDGRYYCVDLGSRTGTHGGEATERAGWLDQGRAIQIGPFAVRPEWPDPADRAEGSLPGVTWEVPNRGIAATTCRMDRHLILFGRSPACKVRLVSADVSKFHCAAVLTVHGVWVVDLLGQGGVLVNDESVRCARLDDGDEVRIGRYVLRARYDSPPAPLPALEPPAPASASSTESPTTVEPPAFSGPPAPSHSPPAIGPRPFLMQPAASEDLAAILEGPGRALDPSVNLLIHQFGLMQQQMFDQFHQAMMMMFEGFTKLHRDQSAAIRDELDQVRALSREIEALRAQTARLAEEAARRPAERPRLAANGHPKPAPPAPSAAGRPPAEPIKKAAPAPPDPNVDIHAQLCQRIATIEADRQSRWQKILGMMSSRS